MSKRHAMTALIALFPLLSSCATAERVPTEPVDLPFSACQKAAVLAFDFESVEDAFYTFVLTLQTSQTDAAQRARVFKFLGDGGHDPATGKRLNNGLPIPLKLNIVRLDHGTNPSIYDKEILEEELQSSGREEFTKLIDKIKLPRGLYRVHVEALADIPALVGTPIGFGIYIRRGDPGLLPWQWRFPSQEWVYPHGRLPCGT